MAFFGFAGFFALLGCTRFGSPRCLAKCGGQGASPRPSASSRAASSSRLSSEPACWSISAEGSPTLLEPRRDGVEPKLGRIDVGHLVPLERAGDAGVGHRAHGVGGGDGAVAGVLVVVDEDPVALLLPPLAGRQLRDPALDLAGQGQGRPPHLGEVLLGLHPHVDVDAARAGGLGEALQIVLGQDLANDHRHPADVVPRGLRRRIEVDAQLVRVVEVGAAHRPGVEVDHPEVHRPDQMGGVVGAKLAGAAAAWEVDGGGLKPLRRPLRHPLLEEELAARPVDESLQRRRPLAQVHQGRVGGLDVVVGEVELGVARFGEEDLVRVRQPHLVPGCLDGGVLAFGCHGWKDRAAFDREEPHGDAQDDDLRARRAGGPHHAGPAGARQRDHARDAARAGRLRRAGQPRSGGPRARAGRQRLRLLRRLRPGRLGRSA